MLLFTPGCKLDAYFKYFQLIYNTLRKKYINIINRIKITRFFIMLISMPNNKLNVLKYYYTT